MDMETYQLARAAKMRAMSEARQKRQPVLEADRQATELTRITEALQSTGGDVNSAAERLTELGHKISRATLFRRVKALQINLASFER
jgi:transcriptional regulator of acetoin/glycerol metabolism